MLDLDGNVVGKPRKFLVQFLHKCHSMADAVEKIRIAKRNVLCSGLYLLANILEHDFALQDPEDAFVDRNNRTVPAKVLASPASLRVTRHAMLAGRKNDI